MDYILALSILIGCVYLAYSRRTKTDIICIHLLWAAATTAALFITGADHLALAYAMLLTVMAGLYWSATEFVKLCFLK